MSGVDGTGQARELLMVAHLGECLLIHAQAQHDVNVKQM